MSAGGFVAFAALGSACFVALGLVVLGIVLDQRERGARAVLATGLPGALAPLLLARAAALAGVLPSPAPAGAAIAACYPTPERTHVMTAAHPPRGRQP